MFVLQGHLTTVSSVTYSGIELADENGLILVETRDFC